MNFKTLPKHIALFLIFTVLIYSISTQVVEAKSFFKKVTNIFKAVVLAPVAIVIPSVKKYVACNLDLIWLCSSSESSAPPPPPPPVNVSISVNPSTIKEDENSNVIWTASNANSCGISNIGEVGFSGSKNVSPSITTTYNLNCSGPGGSASSNATITVIPKPIITFRVSSPPVEYPDSIYLDWKTTNANSCLGLGDWSNSKSIPNGSEYLLKLRGNYIFTLNCSGPGGSKFDTKTTQVIQIPRCNFSANPSSIIPPETSILSWNCLSGTANSCSINQGIGSVDINSGFIEIRPSETTVFSLICNGPDGSRSFETSVDINSSSTIQELLPR